MRSATDARELPTERTEAILAGMVPAFELARVPDPQTIRWRLPKRYLERKTLLAVLRKWLGRPLPATAQLEKVSR